MCQYNNDDIQMRMKLTAEHDEFNEIRKKNQ